MGDGIWIGRGDFTELLSVFVHDRTDAPPNDYTATSRHFIPSKSDESQNDTQSPSMALEDELANWARIMVRLVTSDANTK